MVSFDIKIIFFFYIFNFDIFMIFFKIYFVYMKIVKIFWFWMENKYLKKFLMKNYKDDFNNLFFLLLI